MSPFRNTGSRARWQFCCAHEWRSPALAALQQSRLHPARFHWLFSRFPPCSPIPLPTSSERSTSAATVQAIIELEAQEEARNLAHGEWLALLLDREAADRDTRRFLCK